MKLDNAVLVTGAAKRLGRAMALAMHEQGYNVVLHFNASEHEAQKLRDQMNDKRENSALIFRASLDDYSSMISLCEFVNDNVDELKVLVNNASQFYPTNLDSLSEQDWNKIIDSNVKAPLFISQKLSRLLQASCGCIVNIVDIYGERPLKAHSIYSMSKSALIMQTKSLALELAPDIRVNGIAPGAILWPEGGQDNQKEILDKVALNRVGSEEDIVKALLYLLKADYVTGQILQVDGGRSLTI